MISPAQPALALLAPCPCSSNRARVSEGAQRSLERPLPHLAGGCLLA